MRAKIILTVLLVGTLGAGSPLCVFAETAGAAETAEAAEEVSVPEYLLESDIPYAEDGKEAHLLDVYEAEGTQDKLPVIIEIHGGGLIGGSKEVNADHSNYYADHGFAVVTPNYTLLPEGIFKDAVQDLFSVLSWVENNADTYRFDLDNVFLSGDSTGGYYVFMLASILSSQENQEYYEVTLPGYAVKGYAATCPRTSVQVIRDAYEDENSSGPNSYIAEQIGGEILENDDIMDHADLYKIMDTAAFPEIYFLSTPEDTNYYYMSVDMDAFLNDNQVVHTFVEYTGSENELGHVFNVQDITLPESIAANDGIIEYFYNLI